MNVFWSVTDWAAFLSRSHCYINACAVCVSGNPWAFWTWADMYNAKWLMVNQPHIVKCIKVRGQSEEWLIKSHSEHMAVLKPKAYITIHKTPHGFSHTAGFYCFSLFLYLPLLLLHFLLPVSDVRLRSGLEDIPLSLQRYFTVTWYKCLL